MRKFFRPKDSKYLYYGLLPLNSLSVYAWVKLTLDPDILGVYSLLIMILELVKACLWNPQARVLQLDASTNPKVVMINGVGLGNMISGMIIVLVCLQLISDLRQVSSFVIMWCGLEGIKYVYSSVFVAKSYYKILVVAVLFELIVKSIVLAIFKHNFLAYLFLGPLAFIFIIDPLFSKKMLISKPVIFASNGSLYLRSVANAVSANFDRILLSMVMSLGEFGNFSLIRALITRVVSYGQNVLEDTYKYKFYKTNNKRVLKTWFLRSIIIHVIPLFLFVTLFFLGLLSVSIITTYCFVILVYFLYYLLNNQYNIALATNNTRYFLYIDSFLIAAILLIFIFKNSVDLGVLYTLAISVYVISAFLGFFVLFRKRN